jgi:hypothetical protein
MVTQRRPMIGRLKQNRPDGRRTHGELTQNWGVTAPARSAASGAPSAANTCALRLYKPASAFIIGNMASPFQCPAVGRFELQIVKVR